MQKSIMTLMVVIFFLAAGTVGAVNMPSDYTTQAIKNGTASEKDIAIWNDYQNELAQAANNNLFSMPLSPESLEQLRVTGQLEAVLERNANAYARGVDAPGENILNSMRELQRDDPNEVTLRVPVILVDFGDNQANQDAYPVEHYENMLFSLEGYDTGSMREWYRENSRDEVDIIGEVVGWVRLAEDYSYYVGDNNGRGEWPNNSQRMTWEAVRAVDDAVDFSEYDNDGDGNLDALFVVHAGSGAEANGGDEGMMWSHAWGLNDNRVELDGITIQGYNTVPDDGQIGVFGHELGHNLFGMPDTYDRDYSSSGLGSWCMMAGGSWNGEIPGSRPAHFSLPLKAYLEFIEVNLVQENMFDVEINPIVNDGETYMFLTEHQGELVLVENRQLNGFDDGLPGSGLLIYHADQNVETQNDNEWYPNIEEVNGHYLLAIEPADGNWDLETGENSGDAGDLFPFEGNTSYNGDTTPNSNLYSGDATEIAINNIAINEGVVTCDLLIEADIPVPAISVDPLEIGPDAGDFGVTISNNGETDLEWRTDLVLPEEGRDARGNKDDAGYWWEDSNEEGGLEYQWQDITGVAEPFDGAGDDWNSGAMDLGFDFEWYGETYNQIYICSNGWASFTSNATSYNMPQPPNESAPNDLLLVNNYDFSATQEDANIYFYANEDGAVITWDNVHHYSNYDNRATFQIALSADGVVYFQYAANTEVLNGSSQNIGYESPDGQLGASIIYREAGTIEPEYAIRIQRDVPPDWIAWNPGHGVIAPGESTEMTVSLISEGIQNGQYAGDLHVISNDDINPDIAISITLEVADAPVIEIADRDYNFGEVYTEQQADWELVVHNAGNSVLTVESVESDDNAFGAVGEFPMDIEVGGDGIIDLWFAPVDVGDAAATLTIANNDPEYQDGYMFGVMGVGVDPPIVIVGREDIITDREGDNVVNIGNDGGSNLVWWSDVTEPEPERDRAVCNGRPIVQRQEIQFPGHQVEVAVKAGYATAAQITEWNIYLAEMDARPPRRDRMSEPDEADYLWFDTEDGAEFEWIDIAADENLLNAGDDWNSGALDLGFVFNWYGEEYETVSVNSNGFVALGNFDGFAISLPEAPSAGAPNSVFLPNNQDLDPSGNGNLYFWAGDGIAVASWVGVQEYGAADNQTTFQCIISEDGWVKYQFGPQQNFSGDDSQIGYEDPSGQIGASISNNAADYITEGLAIWIGTEDMMGPSWMSLNIEEGVLEPGADEDMIVTLSNDDLFEGTYFATLHILSNDPIDNDVIVDVEFSVTGMPDITVDPEALNFGEAWVGQVGELSLTIGNAGNADLVVSEVNIEGDGFATDFGAEFTLAPEENSVLTVTIDPNAEGNYEGTLTIVSNDDDVMVGLSGTAVDPPSIVVEHDFIDAFEPGDYLNNIGNEGNATLEWWTELELVEGERDRAVRSSRSLGPLRQVINVPTDALLRAVKGGIATPDQITEWNNYQEAVAAVDPRRDDRSGEPDDLGYEWRDNLEDDGPEFEWLDITGWEGVQEFNFGDDANSGELDLGWTFPFWNNEYSVVFIDSDGYMSFTYAGRAYNLPVANYPSAANAGATNHSTIAVFQDDNWNGTDAWFWTDPNDETAVISWAGDHSYNFQVILSGNGMAKMQYGENIAGNTGLIGVNDGDGEHGWYIAARDNQYCVDGRAIGFGPAWSPDWLTWDPVEGSLVPGDDVDIIMTFSADGMNEGLYEANLHILSNDPDDEDNDFIVNVLFTVGGAPGIDVDPIALDFMELFVGNELTLETTITNTGNADLTISNLATDGEGFSVAFDGEFVIAAEETADVSVTFAPGAAQDYAGTLTISSDLDDVVVDLIGVGLNPPVFGVSPESISTDLIEGDIEEHTITLSNRGGADLEWSSDFMEAQEERDGAVRNSRRIGPQAQAIDVPSQEVQLGAKNGFTSSAQKAEWYSYLEAIENAPPRRDPAGEPDEAGYLWVDTEDGAEFEWIDIAADENLLNAGDDWNSGALDLGFAFNWYGEEYQTVSMNSNGFVALGNFAGFSISLPDVPNAGAPNSVFLPNNQDLDPSGNGNLYFWAGDGIAVASWVGVQEYGAADNQTTFQCIISEDGWVQYQYGPQQNFSGDASQVGYEDPTGEIGASISNNAADFIAEGLAIWIGTEDMMHSWISWEPEEGTIQVDGQDQAVVVTLDTDGLLGGVFEGDLHFYSNDPNNGDMPVHIAVTVDAGPAVLFVPEIELDLGPTFVNETSWINFSVRNDGGQNLEVDEIRGLDNIWGIEEGVLPLEVAPDEYGYIGISFTPDEAGEFDNSLFVMSNDPDYQDGYEIIVLGLGIAPSEISVDPVNVNAQLEMGSSDDYPVTISNSGGSELTWYAEIGAPERDNAGEPDEAGYWWFDNGEDYAPEYQWADIVADDNNINAADDANSQPLDLGFTFNWYGEEYDAIVVNPNGYIALGNDWDGWTISLPVIPSASEPNSVLLPNNLDLDPSGNGNVYFGAGDGYAIVSWVGVQLYGEPDMLTTFQCVITEAGVVAFQYGPQQNYDGNESQIGYENPTGELGVSIHNNEAGYIADGLLIVVTQGEWMQEATWLSVDPVEGSIQQGDDEVMTITLDATDLEVGDYAEDIHIINNDPNNGDVVISVSLTVVEVQQGPEPPWTENDFLETEGNQSVLVSELTFEGEGIPSGWLIAAFAPRPQGQLTIAGLMEWDADRGAGIPAYMADEEAPNQFEHGDRMSFQVWDNETGEIHRTIPTLLEGSLDWGRDNFTMITLELASGGREMNISLHAAWNMMSLNVILGEEFYREGEDQGPDILLMIEQFEYVNEDEQTVNHVQLMKNERGAFCVPRIPFNNIPYFEVTQGYQMRLDADFEATWTGLPIDPGADIPLETGWNLMAYFPTYELDVSSPDFYGISPIVDQVQIMKNSRGNFLVPRIPFGNIPPLEPGQGYQIRVSEDVVLNYPAEQDVNGLGFEAGADPHWAGVVGTDNNMSVLINSVAGFEGNYQIAAISNGRLVGSGTSNEDGLCGLAVWGDVESTDEVEGLKEGESFELRLWNSSEAIEHSVEVTTLEGSTVYEADSFTMLDLTVNAGLPDVFSLSQAYPNPFNATTKLSYGLPEASKVSIQVYDMAGRLVATLVDGVKSAGYHNLSWHSGNASSGMYIVRMESSNFKAASKVMLVR